MKRKLLILIIILVSVTTLEIVLNWNSGRVVDAFLDMLEDAHTASDIEEIMEKWQKARKSLEVYVSYGDTEEVCTGLTEAYVLMKEGESAARAIEHLRESLIRIRDGKKLTFAHFL